MFMAMDRNVFRNGQEKGNGAAKGEVGRESRNRKGFFLIYLPAPENCEWQSVLGDSSARRFLEALK